MSLRDYLPPQISEGHSILRHALVASSGASIRGESYERRIQTILSDPTGDSVMFDTSEDVAMVPVYLFGCRDIYAAVKADVFKEAYENWLRRANKIPNQKQEEYPPVIYDQDEGDESYYLVIGKIPKDAPIRLNSGLEVSHIYNMNAFRNGNSSAFGFGFGSFRSSVSCYAAYQLVNLLNDHYRNCNDDYQVIFTILKLSCSIDEYDELMDCEKIDRINELLESAVDIGIPGFQDLGVDLNCNFIRRRFNSGEQEYRKFMSAPMITDDQHNSSGDIFVRIPGSNLWQCMSIRDYNVLAAIEEVKVNYSKTDKPRAFAKVYHTQEFFADSILDIVKYSTIIAEDLDISYFTDYPRTDNLKPEEKAAFFHSELFRTYEAISVTVSQDASAATVTLTQDELGVGAPSQQLKNGYCTRPNRSRNNFCLFDLILDVAKLHVSMKVPNYEKREPYYY